MLEDNWIIFKNTDELSQRLASDILSVAEFSIKSKNSFKIVLAGGSSVLQTYEILSNSESDWRRWHVYFGDERCLPVKNKDRNDSIINTIWLNDCAIPKQNINYIPVELGVNVAATSYGQIVDTVGEFDVVILGVGEDGHTASLFPGRIYDDAKSVIIEKNSPKYPKNRVSISYSKLNQSKKVFKVVSGSSKKPIVQQWLRGVDFPINKDFGCSEYVYICKDLLIV